MLLYLKKPSKDTHTGCVQSPLTKLKHFINTFNYQMKALVKLWVSGSRQISRTEMLSACVCNVTFIFRPPQQRAEILILEEYWILLINQNLCFKSCTHKIPVDLLNCLHIIHLMLACILYTSFRILCVSVYEEMTSFSRKKLFINIHW